MSIARYPYKTTYQLQLDFYNNIKVPDNDNTKMYLVFYNKPKTPKVTHVGLFRWSSEKAEFYWEYNRKVKLVNVQIWAMMPRTEVKGEWKRIDPTSP